MKLKLGIFLLGGVLIGNVNAEVSILTQNFGFYNGTDFDLKNGNCDTCIDKSSEFYFKNENFVVHKTIKNNGNPLFIWNNSSVFSEGVLSSDGKKFSEGKKKLNFEVASKIPSNLFYYNDSSVDYFSGINLDTFRELGWSIKKQGVESYLKGIAAIPYVSLTDSFSNAKKASNYMLTEKTNLYPFVAFTTLYEELSQKITKKKNLNTEFEKELAEQIEAIIYIKTPQYPSNRATGLAPIASFDEYMSRVPENKANWKIAPVPPRPFPEELKEHKEKQENIAPYTYAIIC